jgi:putative hemolysin
MEFLIIIFLILINGFFAMSEISLVSARRSRLEMLAKNGHAGAKKAVELAASPGNFLSTVQVGITLIGILTGILGGESIARDLESVVINVPLLQPYSHGISLTIVIILITYFSIVIGELLPKRIGLTMPENIAAFVAIPMYTISKIASPFIWLLSKSTEFLIKLFNVKKTDESHVTEEEIKAIVQEGAEAGSIEEIEQDLVTNILHLSDRTVNSLMTPRHQLLWIDSQKPLEAQLENLLDEDLSYFPVCNGNLDNMQGIFQVKDYSRAIVKRHVFALAEWIKKPLFLPEQMKAYKCLETFQKTKTHFGVIVDEYGSVEGVITLNDLLDAMVGDVITEEEDDANIIKREDGSFLVSGRTHLDQLMRELGKVNEETEFNTVAGLVLHYAHHIPATGFSFEWQGYKIEVLDMDGHKIDKVLISSAKLKGSKENHTSPK